ncbi:MAG TPA: septum site-determining protein MinC [Burkholderiaceae bacterium]|nr:septum site-determining protein MinC [Burkholderiaceae bacterium]
MTVAAPAKSTSLLELRSAALTLVAVVLKTTDLSVLARELADRVSATPGLFDKDPVAIDLARVREADEPIDFGALIALLRGHHLVPVAARGGSVEQMAAAAAAGLAEAPDAPRGAGANAVREPLLVTEAVREVQLPAPPPLIVDKPLRSGQQVYARGGDLIVLALVSYGAEVIADGNIHVYAPLRGRALAGAKGDTAARIYTTCMQAQLLSIAGIYRTGEAAVPAALDARAALARLDGDTLLVEALSG